MKLIVLALAISAHFHASTGLTSIHTGLKVIPEGASGTGTTTRYWDCCKPSCGWIENITNDTLTTLLPVATCEADGDTPIDAEIQSSCIGGLAYMCSNQQPFVVNATTAYGFAACSFTGGADTNECCHCYLLTFQGGLTGKQMIVQDTNTGGDLGQNQFDIAIPGGGVGIFTEGCSTQWGTDRNGWGDQYGGVGSAADCAQLPAALQSGCRFRFDFMENQSNPPVSFSRVECPSELTSISGCIVP